MNKENEVKKKNKRSLGVMTLLAARRALDDLFQFAIKEEHQNKFNIEPFKEVEKTLTGSWSTHIQGLYNSEEIADFIELVLEPANEFMRVTGKIRDVSVFIKLNSVDRRRLLQYYVTHH